MFFLVDQPTEQEFEDLAGRYGEMDPLSVKAMVTLLRTGSDLLSGFEKMLNGYGLSQGRFLPLVVMNRNPDEETSPSVLAEKMGITRATMTGLLDGLERDGLIQRQVQKNDRRKQSIRLTDKAKDLLESILPDYWSRISNLMKTLSDNEMKKLVRSLKKISESISVLTEFNNSK